MFRFRFLLVLVGIILATLSTNSNAFATNHEVRMNQVMAGANGNSNIQFIEMEMQFLGQNLWGPQIGETASRARLTFFNSAGTETGHFDFPSNPPSGTQMSVLIATQAFANLPGAPTPDFILPTGLLTPGSGRVRFERNPNSSFLAFDVTLSLTYGTFT